MGFPHHLDSSELCCRQAVTASRHLPSWQSPTDRRRTLLPYQSHRATQTPTTTLTPPTGIYGTPANSCNQMLPRDGTERHARLLYQLMPPHGRPGHKATTSNLSGKQIPDGASAGNIHVVRDSGKQPGEEPAGGASAAVFFCRSSSLTTNHAGTCSLARGPQSPASTLLARLSRRLHSNHQTNMPEVLFLLRKETPRWYIGSRACR